MGYNTAAMVGAREITEAGNTFLVRFAVALLLAHFVVMAPTFEHPPKVHDVIADAKNQIDRQRVDLTAKLAEAERNSRGTAGTLESAHLLMNSPFAKAQPRALQKEAAEEAKKLQQEAEELKEKLTKERQSVRDSLLKLDTQYLDLEKAKAPRQFALPGITTIDAHDILKLYPAIICLGLLRLLEYRRRLINSRGPVGKWPLWAAPVPLAPVTLFWQGLAVNLLWAAVLGVLFFVYSDVARREEFYANSRIFVVNLILSFTVAGWYAAAFVNALLLSVHVSTRRARP